MDIAIYEQDYLTRSLLREWLSGAGYRVCTGAAGARDAGAGGAGAGGAAGLVIVDVCMPKQLDAGWVRAIRARHPDAPIIAISGRFRAGLCADGAAAEALGVEQVIAKPLTRSDLLGAVRGMIGDPS